MNKFLKSISNGSSTLQKRAYSLSESARVAQSNLVNYLRNEKTKLELKECDLIDFSPETTDSLRPISKDWDAETWAKELQEIRQKIYDIKIQLDIAESTYNEFFTEIKDE